MKKIFFFILLIIVFISYMDSGDSEVYSNSSVLNYDIEKTVFKPVKTMSTVIYEDIITEDFKSCTRLAVDNTFNAARILFVNVVDTALENILNINMFSKDNRQDSLYLD